MAEVTQPASLEETWQESWVTPALVIDRAAARRNIDAILKLTAGPARWRPHVKTTKVPEILTLFADAGLRRFKCATTREAEVLAEVLDAEKVPQPDVLVAHHLYGPAMARLDQISRTWPDVSFSVLVECAEQVAAVPERLGVFVDLDLGMGRTGLALGESDTALDIARAAGARFRGLHGYDGHRQECDREARTSAMHETYDELVTLVRGLKEREIEVPEVVSAGTPAFPGALTHTGLAAMEGTVHRVSPGTVVYHDVRSVAQNPDVESEFAATVLSRVASLPGEDRFVMDAGSKAIEGTSECIARVLGKSEWEALWQSEEHTVFRVPVGDARPERGSLLRLVPGHVCPTVNLAEEALLVDDGVFVDVVAVSARAHEVRRM